MPTLIPILHNGLMIVFVLFHTLTDEYNKYILHNGLMRPLISSTQRFNKYICYTPTSNPIIHVV